jgi:hypothetical protein
MSGKEHYHAKTMAANSSVDVGVLVAGFLAKVSGTITITDEAGNLLVDTVPVTAGQFTRIPLLLPTSAGGTVQLAGGAAGTLFC